MYSKHFHYELGKVVHDLDEFTIPFTDGDVDEIWDRIIKDVRVYQNIDKLSWYYQETPNLNFVLEQSDKPDIIYECEDFIMGIECFEFDASRKTKKGSTQRRMQIKTDNAIMEEYLHSNPPNGGILSIEKNVDVDFSAKSYFDSLSINYKQHAASIPEYRQNLLKKSNGKKVFLSFFIEDITAVGNYVRSDGKAESLDPLKLPPFLELLALTKKLDYVIIKITDMYVPKLRIQQLTPELIKGLLKDCYSPDDMYLSYKYKRQSDFFGKF